MYACLHGVFLYVWMSILRYLLRYFVICLFCLSLLLVSFFVSRLRYFRLSLVSYGCLVISSCRVFFSDFFSSLFVSFFLSCFISLVRV